MPNDEQVALLEKALTKLKDVSRDDDRIYHIKPSDHKKIKNFLEESPDRYLDVRDFVSKAIEIFFTWETNPVRAKAIMQEMEKTIPQLAQMKAMMKPEEFKAMNQDRLDNEPGLAESVNQFLKDNPEYLVSVQQENQREKSATEAQEIERRSQGDFQNLLNSKKDSIKFIQDTNFKNINPAENQTEIYYDGWPLLWNYYSRILPAKIAMIGIIDIMRKKKSPVIELDEINKARIYDIAEELSEILRKEEKKAKLKRENKLSTGLPKPADPDELSTNDGKMTMLNSIARYKDRIIGKPRKNRKNGNVSFDGMLSALGLIRTFTMDENKKTKTYITLTENGKKFCLLENPVLNQDYKSNEKSWYAFSNDERQFLVTKLISQRSLEYMLMQTAVKIVKSHSEYNEHETISISSSKEDKASIGSISERLDIKFKDAIEDYLRTENQDEYFGADHPETILSKTKEIEKENKLKAEKKNWKQTPVEAYRVATMGRLAEMGVLKWTIEKDASSSYEIADSDLANFLSK